jgi:hypothetical protein
MLARLSGPTRLVAYVLHDGMGIGFGGRPCYHIYNGQPHTGELSMTFKEKVAQVVQELEPRLEDLAEGHAELLEVDAERGCVTLKLIGGRLN